MHTEWLGKQIWFFHPISPEAILPLWIPKQYIQYKPEGNSIKIQSNAAFIWSDVTLVIDIVGQRMTGTYSGVLPGVVSVYQYPSRFIDYNKVAFETTANSNAPKQLQRH